MILKRTFPLLIIGVFLLWACATTPTGKLAQVGGVVLALNEMMYQECEVSRANGWQPLPEAVCRQAAAAFTVAQNAWGAARIALAKDENALIGPQMVEILRYLFTGADALKAAGLPVPAKVQKYISAVKSGLAE